MQQKTFSPIFFVSFSSVKYVELSAYIAILSINNIRLSEFSLNLLREKRKFLLPFATFFVKILSRNSQYLFEIDFRLFVQNLFFRMNTIFLMRNGKILILWNENWTEISGKWNIFAKRRSKVSSKSIEIRENLNRKWTNFVRSFAFAVFHLDRVRQPNIKRNRFKGTGRLFKVVKRFWKRTQQNSLFWTSTFRWNSVIIHRGNVLYVSNES